MNKNNDWIKTFPGWESAVEFPIFTARAGMEQVHFWINPHHMFREEPLWHLYTHYKPVRIDIPTAPAKLRLQDEDVDSLVKFFASESRCGDTSKGDWFIKGGLFALKCERAWFRAELEKLVPYPYGFTGFQKETCDKMRARCAEEKP